MAANPIVNLITQGARARGLDPQAVLAVASQEGLSGRPGDQGSSFGPFQLHIGGAFPTGQVPRGQEQAWAMSPAGINYALDRIAGVAKGLRGPQAVNAIVSRFERPANVPREIAGANAAYGNYGALPAGLPSPSPSLPVPAPAGAPAVPPPRGLSSALTQAVNTGNQMFGLPPLPAQLLSPVAPAAAPTLAPPAARTLPIPPGPGGGQGAPISGIAKTALTQIGIPYQWGGQAKLGSRTDCSGLLQASARANGVNIGRTTYEQWKQGVAVPLNQLRPGDAVFFHPGPKGPEHVAIYIGNGRIVEDPHSGASVHISALAGRGPMGARRY